MRSVLEFGVPVWHSKITNEEQSEIERVQKSFLHIVFGNDYGSYLHARNELGLETLKNRRIKLYEKLSVWTSWFCFYKTVLYTIYSDSITVFITSG